MIKISDAPIPIFPTLYSITEIAKLLKVHPRTVRRWIDKSDITAHRFGRQIRITDADLAMFISKNRKA
jgi:excisionase family DNA binding protein